MNDIPIIVADNPPMFYFNGQTNMYIDPYTFNRCAGILVQTPKQFYTPKPSKTNFCWQPPCSTIRRCVDPYCVILPP
jgi:hypothetical protein